MKKGEILEGNITEYDFPNKGSYILEDKKVIIKGALPGQKVRYTVKKIRNDKIEGRLLEILEASPLETNKEICPHFGICGGCTYQTLPYENQLCIKEKQVKKLLNSVLDEYEWDGIQGSPVIEGYRNKMEFSFGDTIKDGPLALGMHKKNSFHDIVTVDACKIANSDFTRILKTVLTFYQKREVSFYHKMRREGLLRHLVIRRSATADTLLLNLVTTTQGMERLCLEELVEEILKLEKNDILQGKIAGILHTKNDALADAVISDEMNILYGKDAICETILGMQFKISPFSFFQTNTLGAEALYKTVRNYVGETKDKVIFDLYSGTGTIAQILAPVAKQVIGVEIVAEAVEAAKENANINQLDNCQFIAGDVLKIIDDIEQKPDIIVLDPPRDGIHPKALLKILDYGVEEIVYISCNPVSLVRDLEVCKEQGYQVKRAGCADMFPGTGHVETVCLLSKLHADQHIEIELTMDEIDLTIAESKATYDEIKDYVLKHTGLRVSSLYIAQVKQKCGITTRENFNLPKSKTSKQPKCPPEKETAIKDALEHFRMI